MHEMSLVQNLLKETLRRAAESGAQQIVSVELQIGQFCHESETSLRWYWDEFSKGTPAGGAELVFTIVPGRLECLDCGRAFEYDRAATGCPACRSSRLRLTSGEELHLGRIEVD
jgi:hydrogenase nickel incorporation protein HypA/HybF